MKIKSLFIIVFQIATLCYAQSIDDLLQKESDNTQNLQGEEVTMIVDVDIPQGTPREDIEKEKQDSLSRISDKWKSFLSDKKNEIDQLSTTIQQKNLNRMKKEEIDNFIFQVNALKKDFENRKETNGLWKDNDELDEMRKEFDFACEKTLTNLNQWKEKKSGPSNKLIILGACLFAVMIGIPIFNQIKASNMVRKAKKLQALQTKIQQEEAERQRLLSDDKNIITLNNKL